MRSLCEKRARVCENPYICCDGITQRCDETQASITENYSETVQSHAVLHAVNIHPLQVQRGTTLHRHTHNMFRCMISFSFVTSQKCCSECFSSNLERTAGLMKRGLWWGRWPCDHCCLARPSAARGDIRLRYKPTGPPGGSADCWERRKQR